MKRADEERAQQALLAAEKRQAEVQAGADVAPSADIKAVEQVDAISNAQAESTGRDEAQDDAQAEAQVSEANRNNTATSTDQAVFCSSTGAVIHFDQRRDS